MPLIELGDATKLILSIPSKGDINWSDDIRTDCFQKIVDHDHSSEKGTRIPTAGIAPDAITSALIADDQIDSEHYVDLSIDAGHIAADAVITAKILDLNVTTGKLAADAITEAKLADNAVQVEHKKTEEIASHTGSAETVTAIDTGEAMKINYRIKSSSTYQIGTVTAMCTGASAGYIQDEFIGDSLATFAITSNTIKVDGTSGDEMIFSIEFKENTT